MIEIKTHIPEPYFDPLSREFAQDPYPMYESLRNSRKPHYYAEDNMWMLSRFDDIESVIQNRSMVRSFENVGEPEEIMEIKMQMNWHDMPYHERFVQFSILDSDGQAHDRLRKLVFREFTPDIIKQQRDVLQRMVEKLLDDLSEQEEFDFIGEFAAHIPGRVTGQVLGVPDEDYPQLHVWSENVVQFFGFGRSENDKLLAEEATAEFYHYLLEVLEDRRKKPKNDLITRLSQAENAGQLSKDELISTCMLIVMAGHGSTVDALGNGLHALLRFPDQLSRLIRDPAMMKTGIQEILRYESPLPIFHRFVTEETTVAGKKFTRGQKIGLLYGSANRDPERFPNASEFDVNRQPNRNLAFGGGAHFCLGNHLARLVMDVIFSTIFRRYSSFALAEDEPEYKIGLNARGPKSLRVSFSAS